VFQLERFLLVSEGSLMDDKDILSDIPQHPI
jgi:hypothetical protein